MNWGDELCGVKVTPESWIGGVVGFPGHRWYRVKDDVQCGDDEYFLSAIWVGPLKDSDTGEVYHDEDGEEVYAPDPIFPPRGWAGKSDAELWGACWHIGMQAHTIATIQLSNGVCEIFVSSQGRVGVELAGPYLDNPAALILALQNAQVLARRLA